MILVNNFLSSGLGEWRMENGKWETRSGKLIAKSIQVNLNVQEMSI